MEFGHLEFSPGAQKKHGRKEYRVWLWTRPDQRDSGFLIGRNEDYDKKCTGNVCQLSLKSGSLDLDEDPTPTPRGAWLGLARLGSTWRNGFRSFVVVIGYKPSSFVCCEMLQPYQVNTLLQTSIVVAVWTSTSGH